VYNLFCNNIERYRLNTNKTPINPKILMSSRGFTTIELVVVIIIIGILAVTIIPKMQSTGGYEEIIYQDETVTKLRSIQLRAMQNTSGSECHDVLITSDKLGIPGDSCTSFADNTLNSTTIVKIIDHEVEFEYAGGSSLFHFDHLGRPVNCVSPCEISIVGEEQTLIVAINDQGYIYAKN
ncbi:MAG: prepilin-type N-terminal cleavage/methylation domain-containing protein, partial [Colwellia sp.]